MPHREAGHGTQVDIRYAQDAANNFDGDNGSDPANPNTFPDLTVFGDGDDDLPTTFIYATHARSLVPSGGGSHWGYRLINEGIPLTFDRVTWYVSSEQGPWRNSLQVGTQMTGGFPDVRYARLGTTVNTNGGDLREHVEDRMEYPKSWDPDEELAFSVNNSNGSASQDDMVNQIHVEGRVLDGSHGII